MYKILKGSTSGTFDLYCYNYIREANFYTFLYSARNLLFDDLAFLLQGRINYSEDIDWIPDIVNLTNQPAIIGDDGILRAVPIRSQKGTIDEEISRNREGCGKT